MNNNLIYDINDSPKSIKEWVLFSLQQVFAVFVATVLISQICGTPTSSCLFGACVGTLIYQLVTQGKSPIFISSCGATCSAVIGALAIGNGNNYSAVIIGGIVICVIYTLFALIIKKIGIDVFNRIFPSYIVGAITIVIGLNLATFIPTYVSVNNEHSNVGILVAIFSMLVTALSSHYFKGFMKMIPFLIGLICGYILSIIITLTTSIKLIDFSIFNNISLFAIPDFTFKYIKPISFTEVIQVIVIFTPVAICALLEHYSDHKVLSNIIGTDLTENPGLDKTLIGDGLASLIGTILCGLPNTSYGESIATIGFSKVASRKVVTVAALMLGVMSFIVPIQVFIQSIPSCVFGGLAMVLYGYIAASGLKTIINNKVDLNDNRSLIIVSVILTVGVSGIYLFHQSFAGISLAMVLGVILNVILKIRPIPIKREQVVTTNTNTCDFEFEKQKKDLINYLKNSDSIFSNFEQTTIPGYFEGEDK